ncbi:hypothetical protein [Methanolobus sp. WCC4]|uniref:hypothetical protein n=1 Tax=Methanolobus sp. WCC4 TaxID=3125784 RepID=UPI0030FA0078
MSDFLLAFGFFLNVIVMLFQMLDNVIIFDTHTVLDLLLAFEFVGVTLWGIFELIDDNSKHSEDS